MGHAIENELPFNLHGKRLAVLLELPSVCSAGRSVPNIDACIVSQLMRRFWTRISLEILGCAHNHQPPIRSDARGDHIFADGFAQTYARVEPLFDNIDEPVANLDLQRDIGMLFQEYCKHAP